MAVRAVPLAVAAATGFGVHALAAPTQPRAASYLVAAKLRGSSRAQLQATDQLRPANAADPGDVQLPADLRPIAVLPDVAATWTWIQQTLTRTAATEQAAPPHLVHGLAAFPVATQGAVDTDAPLRPVALMEAALLDNPAWVLGSTATLHHAPSPTIPPHARAHPPLTAGEPVEVIRRVRKCDAMDRCLDWAHVIGHSRETFVVGYLPLHHLLFPAGWACDETRARCAVGHAIGRVGDTTQVQLWVLDPDPRWSTAVIPETRPAGATVTLEWIDGSLAIVHDDGARSLARASESTRLPRPSGLRAPSPSDVVRDP